MFEQAFKNTDVIFHKDAAAEFGSSALIWDTFIGFQKHLYEEGMGAL